MPREYVGEYPESYRIGVKGYACWRDAKQGRIFNQTHLLCNTKYFMYICRLLKTHSLMNLFQQIARNIISLILRNSIRVVELFHDKELLRQRAINLKNYPEGTLGKDISNCLLLHGLRELPHYKDHDMKHVLLGYDMTSVDEIRLQAFMIGNGNYSFSALALFTGGALLLPEEWKTLYQDFQRGKKALPISGWTVEYYGSYQTELLRKMIFHPSLYPYKPIGADILSSVVLSLQTKNPR